MKSRTVSFAVILLILVSGCLGEGDTEHTHTNLTHAITELDAQACGNISHDETNEAIETNTASAIVPASTTPSKTSTTLHPSQAGPSEGANIPIEFTAKVYKETETCRCCDKYFDYLEGKGFDLEVIETNDMPAIYKEYKIPHDLQSCHTLVIDDYFIEGHVPMDAIDKLFTQKPEIDGITLPGKPYGAPGMRGAKSGKLTIYALSDGKPSEFFKW